MVGLRWLGLIIFPVIDVGVSFMFGGWLLPWFSVEGSSALYCRIPMGVAFLVLKSDRCGMAWKKSSPQNVLCQDNTNNTFI